MLRTRKKASELTLESDIKVKRKMYLHKSVAFSGKGWIPTALVPSGVMRPPQGRGLMAVAKAHSSWGLFAFSVNLIVFSMIEKMWEFYKQIQTMSLCFAVISRSWGLDLSVARLLLVVSLGPGRRPEVLYPILRFTLSVSSCAGSPQLFGLIFSCTAYSTFLINILNYFHFILHFMAST